MINHPTELNADLLITTWLTDLQKEYLPNDIFDSLSSEYINPGPDEEAELPMATYLKLSAEADKGRYTRVGMVKDLSGAPTLGANGDQRLSEEEITTKSFRMEYTDVSHATTQQQYGIYGRDKMPYQLFEKRVPLLARYFKQYFGVMRRQTIFETQSENLEDAPHFNNGALCPNWYMPGLSFSDQPVYTDNVADWTDTVVSKMIAAGTGVNAAVSVNWLQHLEDWARSNSNITPYEFEDGTDGYVAVLPLPQCTWLKHPVQAGNAGNLWTSITQMPNGKELLKKYPGMVGQVGGIRVCSDIRYATASIAGSASNAGSYLYDSNADYSMTIQYRRMGRADDGTSDPRDTSAAGRQLGMLLGQHAICEWMPEGFHWEWEYEQYDKFYGSGIFCSVGMKAPIYNVESENADETTAQYDGAIALSFAQPPQTNYYTSQTS